MTPNKNYLNQPKQFWAQIKLVSMSLGYSGKDAIKIYEPKEIVGCLKSHNLSTDHIINNKGRIMPEGLRMASYFKHRARALLEFVEPALMTRDEAKEEFEKLYSKSKIAIHVPYNKQKGTKKHYAYLTGIINILTANTLGRANFDYDPRNLIFVTKNKRLIQTFTRRLDGAYPSTKNPKALWEIKEYYGTTTFGSRVADGVYETMLDGYELKELASNSGNNIGHYLIIDDYFTWWKCGKSYLCRIIDMMHEGFVDEVLFGREVAKRWPQIVRGWA